MNSRAMMAMACAIAFVGNVWALPSYNYVEEERTLYVDVPEGESADFDTANYGALLTGNTITNLVKNGHGGTLSLGSNDFSAYTGRFTFMTGVVQYASADAVGADAVGADVYVRPGATLECTKKGIMIGKSSPRNKLMRYAGFGMNGVGAYHSAVGTSDAQFGMNIVLDDDALFQDEDTLQFRYNCQINLQGHTLYLNTINPGNNCVMNGLRFLNPGHIVSKCGNAFIKDGIAWAGGPENTLTVKGLRSGLYNFPVGQSPAWTLILSANTKDFWLGENTRDWFNPKRNCWAGPVRIEAGKLNVFADGQYTDSTTGEKGCGASFAGKVSGGGLNLLGNIDGTKPKRENMHFHLSSPENDFTNGVSVSLANLHVWTNGALPAADGPLCVTNATVTFNGTSELYALPQLRVSGTGLVENACGRWAGVVKEGAGVFESRSWIGAPTLDVRGGTFKLPGTASRIKGNPLAGVIGGICTNVNVGSTPTVNYNNANPAKHTEVYTNLVSLSPEAVYDPNHHWWSKNQEYGTEMRVVVYSGYLWNNSPTNETWTFGGACTTHFALMVNGSTVIYTTLGNGSLTVASNCVMKVGANPFQIRVYASGNGGGPVTVRENPTISGVRYSSYLYPWDKKGFPWYDPLGRCSSNPDDYQKLEDPGDGSLMTWALPGEALPETLPGTDISTADMAEFPTRLFTSMSFAAGTTLDCSSLTQTVATLTGQPTISNCGRFTVENSWTVDTDDLLSGVSLATTGTLAFGNGSTVAVSQGESCFNADSGAKVLATAVGGIEGTPVAADPKTWRMWKSADEKTLYIAYKPKGTLLSFR